MNNKDSQFQRYKIRNNQQESINLANNTINDKNLYHNKLGTRDFDVNFDLKNIIISNKKKELDNILIGLKKEINEIAKNIIETDKKVKFCIKSNLENSKKKRTESLNTSKEIKTLKQKNFSSRKSITPIYKKKILIIFEFIII